MVAMTVMMMKMMIFCFFFFFSEASFCMARGNPGAMRLQRAGQAMCQGGVGGAMCRHGLGHQQMWRSPDLLLLLPLLLLLLPLPLVLLLLLLLLLPLPLPLLLLLERCEHEYPRSGGKGVGQMEVEPISVITL